MRYNEYTVVCSSLKCNKSPSVIKVLNVINFSLICIRDWLLYVIKVLNVI